MRIPLRTFNRGIYIAEPAEGVPQGALTRGRGIDRETPWISRPGSTAIVAGNAHTISYFNDYYFYSSGTAFLASTRAIAIKTGLLGTRLSCARMAPRAGKADALFVTGGGNLFKVVYNRFDICSTDEYLWNLSAAASEYYLTDSSGNNPALTAPLAILEASNTLSTGTLGALTTGQWNFGDNDTLGYNTIYVRLKDSTTPAPGDQEVNYLECIQAEAHNWGITAPTWSPVASSGVATTEGLTGVYGYRCTFKNTRTGTRSNPSPVPSTESDATSAEGAEASTAPLVPMSRYALLCHFNGTAGSTVTADNSGRGHEVIMYGNCDLDTTNAKFGTACVYFPGATGDYIEIAAHKDWSPNYEPLTLDMWIKFEDIAASTITCILCGGTKRVDHTRWWHLDYDSNTNRIIFRNKARLFENGYFFTCAWDWTPTTGTWYHLALIRGWGGNNERFALTIDGTALTTGTGFNSTTTLPVGCPGDPLRLGSWYYGQLGGVVHHPFKGWMDDVRFINGAAAWTENFTPSSAEYGGSTDSTSSIQYTANAEKIVLQNIPWSADPQVDAVEIWRTQANGAAFFKLTEVANRQSTFTDAIPDVQLGLEECPEDNILPYAWFDDCIGPHNGSMFWITRTKPGERGRLYYSAIGRAETMEGFIEVSSDDDPLQRLVYFQGMLGVLSESRVFQILGTNPYFAKEISGIPGTVRPHSVVTTPHGVAYEASDRTFRLLSGMNANRFDQAIARILGGEAVENLKAWGGGSTATIATYARGEYIISDSSQTLAYAFEHQRWRDLGLACLAFFYNHETDQLLATVGTNVLELEKQGEYEDNGTAIAYAVQTGAFLLSDDKEGVIQYIHIDADTNGETLTCKLVYADASTLTLGTITGSSRTVTTLAANVRTRNAAVRLTGSLTTGQVYLYGIDADVYIPGEERQ